MIIIVEPMRLGLEHQAFNAALIQAAVEAFPGQEIQFWADQSHLDSIAEMLGSAHGVRLVAVAISPRRASLWQRVGPDSRLARQALQLAREPGNRLVFSSITIPLLWACRLQMLAKPSHQVGAVLHGGLAELRWRPKFNLWKRWTGLRWALSHSPRWLTFWALEQSIASALQRFAPELAARFGVFPHPLPPDLSMVASHQPPVAPLAIGLLGLATPQKGLLRFLAVAQELHRVAAFRLVGRVHQDWRERVADQLAVLDLKPEAAPMARALFVSRVRELTYAAFFFEGEHYALTASGVLLDCIALGIPLLGRRHPLFSELEAEVGEIGHFCEAGEEVQMVAELVANFDPARHAAQCAAMRRLRHQRSVAALAERIDQLLSVRQ